VHIDSAASQCKGRRVSDVNNIFVAEHVPRLDVATFRRAVMRWIDPAQRDECDPDLADREVAALNTKDAHLAYESIEVEARSVSIQRITCAPDVANHQVSEHAPAHKDIG